MNLPIDIIQDSNPPRFRWRQTVSALGGPQVVECEGYLDSSVEKSVMALIVVAKKLEEELAKLQAFKNWTHDYLDKHGVPHHPAGTHGAAGCRIGDRMDWLMKRMPNHEQGQPAPKKGK